MADQSDTKIAIERLQDKLRGTTDPVLRAQLQADIDDIAGSVGDIPGLLDGED